MNQVEISYQQTASAPTTASAGPVDLKKKFPGLERRKFALPQKFVSLQSIDIEAQMQNDVRSSRAGNSNKIGFFHLNQTNEDASSSEYSEGFQSSSSDSTTSDDSDDGIGTYYLFLTNERSEHGKKKSFDSSFSKHKY